jgi:ABC-type Fe3+-siderophore transport system permease subunit
MRITATDPVSGVRPVQGTPSRAWWLAVGVVVLVTASAAALTAGAYRISVPDLWRLLTGRGALFSGGDGQSAVAAAVMWNLRMPRSRRTYI